jgi:hypothetical protein
MWPDSVFRSPAKEESVMDQSLVYVWGSSDDDLVAWPSDFTPLPTKDISLDRPIVVFGSAMPAFTEVVRSHVATQDGHLPEAILLLPSGESPTQDAWVYFDAILKEGDWHALRSLLACSRSFEMAEMVEELPGMFVAGVLDPTSELRVADLPLSSSVRSHLAACQFCRRSFDDALERRLNARDRLFYPSFVSSRQPVRTERWLTVPLQIGVVLHETLPSIASDYGRAIQDRVQTLYGSLETILASLFRANMLPAAARVRRATPSVTSSATRLSSVLENLSGGQEVILTRPYRDLALWLDTERQSVQIGGLHGDQHMLVVDFTVTFNRAEEILWQTESHNSQVTIPLSVLADLIADGADEMAIEARE